MRKKKYKIGLLIGRFQPFHKGHDYLIKKVLKKINRLVIGIGSSNLKNKDNPLSYRQRKKLLELYFEKEGIKSRVAKIVPLPDFPSDKKWLLEALKRVGKINVVVGHNEWTNGIFERAGFPILRVPLYQRKTLEARKIRELIRKGKKYDKRLPKYLTPLVKKLERKF